MFTKFTLALFSALFLCSISSFANITEADDAVFHIECPPDVTVDCDAELWDLTIYGWAYVYGYGSPVPANAPVVTYNLNSCGTGHIVRTWTAYDYSNQPYTCSQYIYVGGGGFSGYNIHWPPNYETSDCNADLDPDDLPAPFDYPTYDVLDCSMIMIGYDDEVFDFGGGCKKILRKWSVLDWCTHNPNYPYGGGRWDYTQVIKIKPVGGLMLDCPDDITVSAGANCSGTYVDIPKVTGMGACGSNVQVTNNQNGGSDASGYYPYGTTWVKFTAEDACGNWESCKMKVTVKDMKKPTPICYNGLTANLMLNSDGYYIDLDPKWFNKGSFDNCTPKHLLTYRIVPSRFTCDERGRQDVRVYVKDQDGNEQYCNTYVIIQDNMGMCPPIDTTTFTLAGQLTNVQGSAIKGITLELLQNGDVQNEVFSDGSGAFDFRHVLNNEDYMIIPRGNDEYTKGLSTFDLLKLAKHVYNVKALSTDSELLAADANQNGEVDIQDLLILRKLLLRYTTTLPNHKAWRFIPSDLLAGGMSNPLQAQINEYWETEDLYSDFQNIDFTAIKIGDINGSVQDFGSAEERSAGLHLDLLAVQKDNRIDIVSTKSLDLSGLQLNLNFDDNQLDRITSGKLEINGSHARVTSSALLSWFTVEGSVSVSEGDVLFSIQLTSSEKIDLAALNSVLLPEAYSASDLIYSVSLTNESDKEQIIIANTLESTVSIFPNPAKLNNGLQIVSTNAAIKEVVVYDSKGQIRHTQQGVESNEMFVSTKNLQPGLFFLQVNTTDGKSEVNKVILE